MAKLHIIKGPAKGEIFDLTGQTVFIGRSSISDIQINDETVSRMQLKITRIANTFFVEDLRSTNGTFINDERIEPGEGFEVNEEDTISIGNSVLRLGEISPSKAFGVKDFAPAPLKKSQNGNGGFMRDRRSPSPRSLRLICRVAELMRQSLNINDVLEKTVEYLLDILPRIDRAAVLLIDDNKRQIKEVISRSRQDQPKGSVCYGRVVVDQVLRDGNVVSISNTSDMTSSDMVENMDTLKIKSVLCVPMTAHSRIRGAIYIDSLKSPHGFREEDFLLLNSLSGPTAVAIENDYLASRLH